MQVLTPGFYNEALAKDIHDGDTYRLKSELHSNNKPCVKSSFEKFLSAEWRKNGTEEQVIPSLAWPVMLISERLLSEELSLLSGEQSFSEEDPVNYEVLPWPVHIVSSYEIPYLEATSEKNNSLSVLESNNDTKPIGAMAALNEIPLPIPTEGRVKEDCKQEEQALFLLYEEDENESFHISMSQIVIEAPLLIEQDNMTEYEYSDTSASYLEPEGDENKESRERDTAQDFFVSQPMSPIFLDDVQQQFIPKSPVYPLSEEMLAEQPASEDEDAQDPGQFSLSYTFNQWEDNPVVTVDLSTADEYVVTTSDIEVQQVLQEYSHWFETESSLRLLINEEQDGRDREQRQHSEHEEEA